MSVKLKGRDLLSIADLTEEEFWELLEFAKLLKLETLAGKRHEYLKGKTLAMIFQKPSTRTRVAFEVGMYQLGGYALYLSSNDMQLRRGETIADTARVLSRFVDGIMARVFDHQDVVDLAKYGSVPVINGLSDEEHPSQVLADFLTIWEKFVTLKGLKLAYVGDGNNVAHSLLLAAGLVGMDIAVATPQGYEPKSFYVEKAKELAARHGSSVQVLRDPVEAVTGANAVYTDVWASMGQEAEHEERLKIFKPYQVNPELMSHADKNAIFLHCLPAHRGEEVVDEVADSPQSAIFDEAENRLHAHKAILALLMGD
ncbi:MAG TPA: ornithine carbamoyltransferase [Coprothermobacter proteolyticus]|nr:ornithine carbamoyltransferase [Coprothermobacter proteolyticus]